MNKSFLGALIALMVLAGAALPLPTSAAEPSAGESSAVAAGLGGSAYVLAPSDEIEVFVWKEEDISRKVTIRPDGGVSYPLVGEIQAAGQSVAQLQQTMQARIREYVPSAVVSVSLIKVSGYRIYVLGEVKNPVEFVLNRYVTVAQALTLADGLTPFAKQSDILIVREENGVKKSLKFNYKRFTRGKNLDANIRLQAGDIVSVP